MFIFDGNNCFICTQQHLITKFYRRKLSLDFNNGLEFWAFSSQIKLHFAKSPLSHFISCSLHPILCVPSSLYLSLTFGLGVALFSLKFNQFGECKRKCFTRKKNNFKSKQHFSCAATHPIVNSYTFVWIL